MDRDEVERFEGWAVIELFGHNREAGHVTTAYFGTAAMFRIEIPDLPQAEVELESSGYYKTGEKTEFVPTGSKVLREAVAGKTRYVSPGAVYALNPCSEAVVRKLLGHSGRVVKVIDIPSKALPEPSLGEFDQDTDEVL